MIPFYLLPPKPINETPKKTNIVPSIFVTPSVSLGKIIGETNITHMKLTAKNGCRTDSSPYLKAKTIKIVERK